MLYDAYNIGEFLSVNY